jgi:hypothetical protein
MRGNVLDFDPNGIWKPACWTLSSDDMANQAKQQLWADYGEIVNGVLNTSDRAISGNVPGTKNENEELMDIASNGASHRDASNTDTTVGSWQDEMDNMRRTEPLAAWANGAKTGPANPPA